MWCRHALGGQKHEADKVLSEITKRKTLIDLAHQVVPT